MTNKNQGVVVALAIPPCVLAAILLKKYGTGPIFGLGPDFLAGIFVGFAIIFSTVGIAKLSGQRKS